MSLLYCRRVIEQSSSLISGIQGTAGHFRHSLGFVRCVVGPPRSEQRDPCRRSPKQPKRPPAGVTGGTVRYHCRQTRLGRHGPATSLLSEKQWVCALRISSGGGTQDDDEAKRTGGCGPLYYLGTLALRFSVLAGEHGPCRCHSSLKI